jgi:alanine racemase
MVDVTGIECNEGDEVVIFGGEGGSVVEMAELLGTIPYEVMTSISARVKRIYVKE